MQYLKEHTEEIHHGLLEECKEKLVLYQSHRVHVADHHQAIDSILGDRGKSRIYCYGLQNEV